MQNVSAVAFINVFWAGMDRVTQKVKKKKSVVLGRRQRQISKNTKKIN